MAVLGSGGAGLTAAILAHDNGAKVAIIERSPFVGGTTAVSGGGVWIALNHHMAELGIEDSREDALAYCKRLAAGRASGRANRDVHRYRPRDGSISGGADAGELQRVRDAGLPF